MSETPEKTPRMVDSTPDAIVIPEHTSFIITDLYKRFAEANRKVQTASTAFNEFVNYVRESVNLPEGKKYDLLPDASGFILVPEPPAPPPTDPPAPTSNPAPADGPPDKQNDGA